MLEEVIDLTTGLGVLLLPLLLLAVPGIILFVVLPGILLLALAAPLALIGAVIALPPYLVARWLRRRDQSGLSPDRARMGGIGSSWHGRTAPSALLRGRR
jgi:hypothetical protein